MSAGSCQALGGGENACGVSFWDGESILGLDLSGVRVRALRTH